MDEALELFWPQISSENSENDNGAVVGELLSQPADVLEAYLAFVSQKSSFISYRSIYILLDIATSLPNHSASIF